MCVFAAFTLLIAAAKYTHPPTQPPRLRLHGGVGRARRDLFGAACAKHALARRLELLALRLRHADEGEGEEGGVEDSVKAERPRVACLVLQAGEGLLWIAVAVAKFSRLPMPSPWLGEIA